MSEIQPTACRCRCSTETVTPEPGEMLADGNIQGPLSRSVFHIPGMDCPSEEQMIRLQLVDAVGRVRSRFRGLGLFQADRLAKVRRR